MKPGFNLGFLWMFGSTTATIASMVVHGGWVISPPPLPGWEVFKKVNGGESVTSFNPVKEEV